MTPLNPRNPNTPQDPMQSVALLLKALHLPAMVRHYKELAERAEKAPWSHVEYLRNLCEQELADRAARRIANRLKESGLPMGKTMDTLDPAHLPLKVRRQIPSLLEGTFVRRAENVLAFGLPGRGKTHLLCAIARELVIQRDCRVFFTTTFHLVQRMLRAKRDVDLDALLRRLDRFDVVLLDDIGYVQQDRQEMEVLFTFLSERYERRSVMITSNLVFSGWDKIFKDPMTTAAAIDRLVHHSVILELDNESYRAREARQKQKESEKGRPEREIEKKSEKNVGKNPERDPRKDPGEDPERRS